MADSVIVTVKHPGVSTPRDVELPAHVLVSTLAPLLVEALGWFDVAGPSVDYEFQAEETDIVVRPDQTLATAGVLTGDILLLHAHRCPGPRRRPELIGPRGVVFELRGNHLLVGRVDPARGLTTDRVAVDLTTMDPNQSVSRKHAQIRERDGTFWVEDLDSMNGTWLNDQRLEPGTRSMLRPGARVRFGEIEFTFALRD